MPVSTHTPLSPMFFAVDAGGGETSHGDRSEHSSPYKQQQYVIDIHSNKLYSTGGVNQNNCMIDECTRPTSRIPVGLHTKCSTADVPKIKDPAEDFARSSGTRRYCNHISFWNVEATLNGITHRLS